MQRVEHILEEYQTYNGVIFKHIICSILEMTRMNS